MSKKKSEKVASVPATPATASTNPVPTGVSAPPEGWVEPAKLGKKGRRPRNGLPLVAPNLAAELRKNAPALFAELGAKAVDPQQLAAALDTANAWDGVDAKASTFHVYTRTQRAASWDGAMTLMGGMKLGVRYALSRDATFADRFPGVAKAFAPTHRPKKGTATEAAAPKAPKASKKAPAAPAPEPAVTPAEAAPPAPPQETAPPAPAPTA